MKRGKIAQFMVVFKISQKKLFRDPFSEREGYSFQGNIESRSNRKCHQAIAEDPSRMLSVIIECLKSAPRSKKNTLQTVERA